jgi:TolA-binding protein
MDAVTYPDAKVARFLDENFVPVKINVTESTPEVEEAKKRFNQVWTPLFLFLSPDGREARRSQGYFPPEDFLAELELGLGQLRMLEGDHAKAYDKFQHICKEHPNAQCAPEAMYWSGVSAYKRDNKPDGLMQHWNELKDQHPDSPWWTKASFIDKG